MCDVVQLQPAGAFLRQAQNLQASIFMRKYADPITVVGSCTDIDVALRFRPDCDKEDTIALNLAACKIRQSHQDESLDFLSSICRGLDELVTEASREESDDEDDEDEEDDDDSDNEGRYYQASRANAYYSPGQKLSCGFPLDDALDLSNTSTASSSLFCTWAQQETDDEEDADELIFQLEM